MLERTHGYLQQRTRAASGSLKTARGRKRVSDLSPDHERLASGTFFGSDGTNSGAPRV
jgi:hypothetical protein